jgi:sulfatase modifying factor 1
MAVALALTAAGCGRVTLGSLDSLGEGSSGSSGAAVTVTPSTGEAGGAGSGIGDGPATSSSGSASGVGGSALGAGGSAPGVGGSALGAAGSVLVAAGSEHDAGAEAGSATRPQDSGAQFDAASHTDDSPPSCVGTRLSCGEDEGLGSCCESLRVPGGSFALTVDNGRIIPATVSSFRLDRFEVTVGRMRAFIADYDAWRGRGQPAVGLGAHPLIADSGWQERFTEQLPANAAAFEAGLRHCGDIPYSTYADGLTEAVPLNCASWFEAAAFCAWDGGRLPTFAELAYAGAGGDENRIYPWGDTPVPRRELALFGCRIDFLSPICSLDDVLPAGAQPLGAGRFGHDDLAGSMSERVLDGMPGFGESCTDCANLADESVRMWRGGGWLDGADSMKNAPFSTGDAALRLLFLGFRCARDE